MKICGNCFNDKELKAMLNQYDSVDPKAICPNCKNESKLYDIHLLDSIRDMMEGFLDNYVIHESGKPLGREIKKQWKIFNDSFNEDLIAVIIQNLCLEYCKERKDLFTSNVILEKLLNSDYRDSHLALSTSWDQFTKEIIEVNRYHSRYIQKDVLKSLFSYVETHYSKNDRFFRARTVSKDYIYRKNEMGAPGGRKSSEGRINARGVNCLYLATDEETCIKEIRAGAFEYVCVGTFTVIDSLRLVNLAKITEINPFYLISNNTNIADIALNKSVLEDMDKSIRKPQSSKDDPLDYVPTQFLADYIKSIVDENGNPIYDGIEFKSTHSDTGRNVVLFDADSQSCKCECTNVNKYYIKALDYKKSIITNESTFN